MQKAFYYLCILVIISCNNNHNKEGVELAMKHYDQLIKKMDADSIAWLYTPDGDLGGIAYGRDSIKKFLSTFKNVSVLSQLSKTISIEMQGDTSIQKGSYQQTVLLKENDTLKVKGGYTATWQWIPHDGWHIKRMITKSEN